MDLAKDYSKNLLEFFEISSKVYEMAFEELIGIDTYEIDILKVSKYYNIYLCYFF